MFRSSLVCSFKIRSYSGAKTATFRLSVHPMVSSRESWLRCSSMVSFQRDIQRSARMIKSVPLAVSSTCLWPFWRITRGKPSSFSREVSRWLTVGCERKRRSAVRVMLFVLTMVRNVSISKQYKNYLYYTEKLFVIQ